MLAPKKRFGQNFLVDQEVVADLVAAAELRSSDLVVEVGAGTGVLTRKLAQKAGKVIAFEIDRDLIPLLKKELADFSNVEVVNQDFLKVENLDKSIQLSQIKIVGSIPYQITSPLIHKLLTFEPRPSLVVLLIQKEVAEKITAQPPRATYLSNITKLLGKIKIVRFVPRTAFRPVPEVGGAIIKLKTKSQKLKDDDLERFPKLLRQGFQHPRKMLRNKFDPQVLKKVGIDPCQRAQELTLIHWINLFRELTK